MQKDPVKPEKKEKKKAKKTVTKKSEDKKL